MYIVVTANINKEGRKQEKGTNMTTVFIFYIFCALIASTYSLKVTCLMIAVTYTKGYVATEMSIVIRVVQRTPCYCSVSFALSFLVNSHL